MFGTWTTITGGNLEVLEPKTLDLSYEKMQSIEENTPYEFSTTDKITTLANEVGAEAKKTAAAIDETLSNVGTGISNGAKVLKYLPFMAILGGAYFIYVKANHGK